MESVELKSSLFALAGSGVSGLLGWISFASLSDAVIIAFVSAGVGYYAPKVFKFIDHKIKAWIIKRNKRKKLNNL